jgi:hypothetical protein
LAEIDPSGISRAPHEQPFQRPREANERRAGRAAETALAGPVAQATCLAELPLLHSTLEPTAMRELQQGQTEAKRAVMTMVRFLSERLRVSLGRGGTPLTRDSMGPDDVGVKRHSSFFGAHAN